jgi:hypothetical protein
VSAHNAFWPRLETFKFGTTTGLRNLAAVSVYVSEIISYEFSIPQPLFRATTSPLKLTTFVDDTHDVAAFPEVINRFAFAVPCPRNIFKGSEGV